MLDIAKARGVMPAGLFCICVRDQWMRGRASAYAEPMSNEPRSTTQAGVRKLGDCLSGEFS